MAPTRSEIAETIAELRKRAERYGAKDSRRAQLDDEVDALVNDWLTAPA